MRTYLVAISVVLCLSNCGRPPKSDVKAPTNTEVADRSDTTSTESIAPQKPSETRNWSEVEPMESSGTAVDKRKARILVTSDSDNHVHSLHFRFFVNAVPISGVFVAPGGQSTTFMIPVGTVHFTVDECEWEAQGFELAPDEEIPISCKLAKEGECCEVAIPVQDEERRSPGKGNAKTGGTKRTGKGDEGM
jgi:hypothetical protein